MSRTRRPGEAVPSGTQVQTEATPQGPAPLPVSGTLRLRGEPLAETTGTATDEASSRRIRWSEDVVDNEGMGKKSSKVCCIYHKSHPVGESSSESESEDSSSSSDSDSDSDGGRPGAKRPERGRQKRDKKCDEHDHGPGHHKHKGKRRKPSPNAYERVPNYTKKHPEVQGT